MNKVARGVPGGNSSNGVGAKEKEPFNFLGLGGRRGEKPAINSITVRKIGEPRSRECERKAGLLRTPLVQAKECCVP